MKRYGNIWPQVCDAANVSTSAHEVIVTTLSKMRKRKEQHEARIIRKGLNPETHPYRMRTCEAEAIYADEHFDEYTEQIRKHLTEGTYAFGRMIKATVHDPKERTIDYPEHLDDRVYHHCLVNVTGPYIIRKMTADTYGSLKGRGLTDIAKKMRKVLAEHPDWYFVQTDFRHYYESIRHDIIKQEIRRVFKDKDVIRMYDAVTDHFSEGLAIGVWPSSYIANLYCNRLDHYMKEVARIPYYFRYMDDIVCIVESKDDARKALGYISDFAATVGLTVKPNARIAPVTYGIRTCGYDFFPTHTRLRKSIKTNMKRSIAKWKGADDKTFKRKLASHFGWCSHADCRNLVRSLLKDKYYIFRDNMEYKRLSDIKAKDNWFGLPKDNRISVKELFGKEIIIFEVKDIIIRGEDKIAVRFAFPDCEGEMRYFITKSSVLADRLAQVSGELPLIATIQECKNYYTLT